MDEQSLATSSDRVRERVEALADSVESEEFEGNNVFSAQIFRVLAYYDHPAVEKFLNEWSDEHEQEWVVPLENPEDIIHLLETYRLWETDVDRDKFHNYIRILESNQTVDGNFILSDAETAPIWIFAKLKPDSPIIKNAISHFISDQENWSFEYHMHYRNLALGALGLCEYDYHAYKNEIEMLSEKMVEILADGGESAEKVLSIDHYGSTWPIFEMLAKAPQDFGSEMEALFDDSELQNDICSSDMRPKILADEVLCLIAKGEGPKRSIFGTNWQMEKEVQRQEYIRPKFVQTVPISPSAEYAAEIQKSAQNLIESADDMLRVDSLYIDMLFDQIIDRIVTNPELEVRILTRGRDVRGSRQGIKKDVLNDLIEVTDGNVKEHHRLHSRVLISDEQKVLVSSADLTRDQLRDEFNAGVLTQAPNTVESAIEYFDEIWEDAEHVEHT